MQWSDIQYMKIHTHYQIAHRKSEKRKKEPHPQTTPHIHVLVECMTDFKQYTANWSMIKQTGDHQLEFYMILIITRNYRWSAVMNMHRTYPQREASTGHGRLSPGVL